MSESLNGSSSAVVVILAGGFGTRIRHLLNDIPKPMALTFGRPFLEWVIHYFRSQGIKRFVISTGYRAEFIESYFETNPVSGIELICIPESEPLGTAGGFLNAVTKSGFVSPLWLVANGDSLALTDVGYFLKTLKSSKTQASILGLSVPDTSRYGTLDITSSCKLINFAEKRSGSGLINAGVYAFTSSALESFPQVRPLSFELDVFPSLLSALSDISVVPVSAPFLDIGTPASLKEAGQFIESNLLFFN